LITISGVTDKTDVFDITGKLLVTNNGGTTIDASGLSAGIYLLKIHGSFGTGMIKVLKK
jgi:hypothetical protein